jgi:uncharacterized SAM-binding protein YcdF (DUF218 family)
MIFSRKYVFESKKTRALRLALNAAVLLGGLILLYVTFLIFTIVTARSELNRLSEGLYQKAPDAIVIFTGDKGRMKRGLELTRKWPEAKLLISGVHGANTLQTIVAGHADAQALLNSPQQVDLDYEAQDTLGNVRETLKHIDSLQEPVQSLLVVTSDYHVLRVRMIFRDQLAARPLVVFYDGISSDWSSWSNIKKLLIESLKTLRAWFILVFN